MTRYVPDAPGFAYPTAIASSESGGRVTISCVLTDIVYDWTLSPRPPGCAVRLRVEIPRGAGRQSSRGRCGTCDGLRAARQVAEREAGA